MITSITAGRKTRKEIKMQTEKSVEIVRLSDIALQEVEWLQYPYSSFGKITIIQGDLGEGKTTLVLSLAAVCSDGTALPGIEQKSPYNVNYQTVEDGLAVLNNHPR